MGLCTNLGYTKSIQVNTDMFKDYDQIYLPSNKNYPNEYFQKTSASFIFDTSISLPNTIFSEYTLYYGRTLHYGTIIYNKYFLYVIRIAHVFIYIHSPRFAPASTTEVERTGSTESLSSAVATDSAAQTTTEETTLSVESTSEGTNAVCFDYFNVFDFDLHGYLPFIRNTLLASTFTEM